MVYKIYVGKETWNHPKNEEGLNLLINEGYLERTFNIDEANILLYTSNSPHYANSINEIDINDTKYKNKIIILGPHFSITPTPYLYSLQNINNNIIYNTLSEWVTDLWNSYLKNANKYSLEKLPFPVNTKLFKPDDGNKEYILIYIKSRFVSEYQFIIDYMNDRYTNIKIFNYDSKYSQEDYIATLKKSKFGIWIGRHESQGFALQEALSTNVPLLVYNIKYMGQSQCSANGEYRNVDATTIPYWDNKCGEFFYEPQDFILTLNKFLLKCENNEYQPREFILNTLNTKSVYNKFWKPILEKYIQEV